MTVNSISGAINKARPFLLFHINNSPARAYRHHNRDINSAPRPTKNPASISTCRALLFHSLRSKIRCPLYGPAGPPRRQQIASMCYGPPPPPIRCASSLTYNLSVSKTVKYQLWLMKRILYLYLLAIVE